VILYADRMTNSIERAVGETERRRRRQEDHNRKHGITPVTIRKAVAAARMDEDDRVAEPAPTYGLADPLDALDALEREMLAAAEALEFERAAELRDRIRALKRHHLLDGL